jgi:hypothetical protein
MLHPIFFCEIEETISISNNFGRAAVALAFFLLFE